jgi:hypothetical protein
MPTPSELQQEIEALHAALRREREVSAAERRRAELLEAAAKHAYRLAAGAWPAHKDDTKTEGER